MTVRKNNVLKYLLSIICVLGSVILISMYFSQLDDYRFKTDGVCNSNEPVTLGSESKTIAHIYIDRDCLAPEGMNSKYFSSLYIYNLGYIINGSDIYYSKKRHKNETGISIRLSQSSKETFREIIDKYVKIDPPTGLKMGMKTYGRNKYNTYDLYIVGSDDDYYLGCTGKATCTIHGMLNKDIKYRITFSQKDILEYKKIEIKTIKLINSFVR